MNQLAKEMNAELTPQERHRFLYEEVHLAEARPLPATLGSVAVSLVRRLHEWAKPNIKEPVSANITYYPESFKEAA